MKKLVMLLMLLLIPTFTFAQEIPNTKVKTQGNYVAKKWGGKANVILPPNHKLVMITWKQDDMWILYRPFRDGERAEYYIYEEDSRWGLVEGKVVIQEVEE